MKKILLLAVVLFVACSSPTPLTLQQVQTVIATPDAEILNESTDPNHLLNRPNSYREKVIFTNGTIEVFANQADAVRRKEYVDKMGLALPMVAEQSVVHKNVLLRVSNVVTPTEFAKMSDALKAL